MGTFWFSGLWPENQNVPLFDEAQGFGGHIYPRRASKWRLALTTPSYRVELGLTDRLIDPYLPVRRNGDRRLADDCAGMAGSGAANAGPPPVDRAFDEVGANRVSLDVSHNRQKVPILLNGKGLETPLPYSPRSTANAVVAADMARQKPLHPTAHVSIIVGPDHEVKVIRHQTIRQYPHRNELTCLAHQASE